MKLLQFETSNFSKFEKFWGNGEKIFNLNILKILNFPMKLNG